MSANIFNMNENDLDVFTNKILNLNKGLDTSNESYKVELLEQLDSALKICYVHDFYKDNKPTLEHHVEEIELELIYKKIEDKLFEQNLFKLKSKDIDNLQESSVNCHVDVMLHDECVYFQVEDTKLQSYIRVYDWATN